MKKTYTMPSQLVCELQVTNNMLTPLSLQGSAADPNAEVLTKEYLWMEEEDDDNTPKDPKFFD